MEWAPKHIALVGLGISNLALARYLLRAGARVTACDQKSRADFGPHLAEWESLGVPLRLGPSYLDDLNRFDAIALTPGMPKDLPPIEAARQAGVPITSEMTLFFAACRANIAGVTGSSGKTTTTSLLGRMVEATGKPVYVGGNIGRPLIDMVDAIPTDAWIVLELSSFQLELIDLSPQVAVVTNVTPNHLDQHGTMDAYSAAKARIYQFQAPGDWAVFNADDPITQRMSLEAPGCVAAFSRTGPVAEGSYAVDGTLYLVRGGKILPVGPVDELRLPGRHNLENALAACAAASLCGVEPGAMREVLRTFAGVPHRLEHVADIGDIAFYNDSIATTPSRTIAGLQSFDRPLVLIAGGYDKRLPFEELATHVLGRVHTVVLIGQTAEAIARAIEAAIYGPAGAEPPRIVRARSLPEAVEAAHQAARPGDVVLLSPACASYGMFRNFEERGDQFRRLVAERATDHSPALKDVRS